MQKKSDLLSTSNRWSLAAVRTELLAGITTFFTMAYIVIVNPMILSQAGMDYGAVFVATCLSAALGSFLMSFLANYPIALAPAMSLNVYFTFYVVQKLHYSWQEALGFVCAAGILFALLTFTQIRQWLIYTLPQSLKLAIAAGIGFFLVVIAFKSLGVSIGAHHLPRDLFSFKTGLAVLGVVLAFWLDKKKIIGSILIAMLAVTLIGKGWHFLPQEIMTTPPSIAPSLLQLKMPSLLDWQSITIILIFLFVTLFDNTGTLIAVLHQAHLLPQNRHDVKAPRLGKALLADSLASISGALLGTSSTGSYIESAAGVQAGGRTGLTSFTVGVLFLFALFFAPLAKAIPDFAAASALLFVGTLMAKNLKHLTWHDWTESAPALICIAAIPLTFSIADGISAGLLSYILLKIISGKKNQLSGSFIVLGLLCVAYFAIRL